FSAIHPDDRERARESFARSLRDGVPYDPEVRLQRDDGSYVWVRAHGRIIRGPDGKPRELTGVIVDIDEAKRASLRAEEERRIKETLHRLGSSFASELDEDRLIQLITDEVTTLVGAELGVFFRQSGEGAAFSLHTASPAAAESLRKLCPPRATPLLSHTVVQRRTLRLDDVLSDERYGAEGLLPSAHPPIRSYLAVPVGTRSGEALGSLHLGHGQVGRFSDEHEQLVSSIARQAAVALENARLYNTVRHQKELLESAVARAQQADRRKDEFLAMLGHELRNPLAPIGTALALMDLKRSDAFERERAVIRRQVDHLTRLVDDLLDVSRITRGKIELSRQVIELSTVLTKALEMVSPLFEKRAQRLDLELPRESLLVDADSTRLAQVFQNLLSNAAKYSPIGASISMRAYARGERLLVEIRDPGVGIAPELLPRLFEPFVQGESTRDRAQGGLGIGLNIARSLCELHQGNIRATSEGPGRGSTFIVELPQAAEGALAAPVSTIPPSRRARRSQRVLVVDDNIDAANLLQDYLVRLGHTAEVAHDGVVALVVARSFRPEVALLDIGLPVMDGYELALKLRDQQGADALRLIALTGYGQNEDRARALQAGLDHPLVKPIELHARTALFDS
ncbi:MAG TPA: ATP-binding protein, partial [Polyangiaceae bacterium]|nr:ATP-binding protein [Polyangiaceae bacterium]